MHISHGKIIDNDLYTNWFVSILNITHRINQIATHKIWNTVFVLFEIIIFAYFLVV